MTSPAVAATGEHDEIRGGNCSLPERAFAPGRDRRVMHGRLDRRSARRCSGCRGAAGQRFRSVFSSVESKVSAGQPEDAEGQQSHERNRGARNGIRGAAKCLRADRSLQHGGSRQYRPRHPGGHPVFRLGVALRAGRTSNFFGNTEIFWRPPCDSGGQCSIRDFANHSLSPNLSEMCQPQWLNGNIKLRGPTTLAPPATAQARARWLQQTNLITTPVVHKARVDTSLPFAARSSQGWGAFTGSAALFDRAYPTAIKMIRAKGTSLGKHVLLARRGNGSWFATLPPWVYLGHGWAPNLLPTHPLPYRHWRDTVQRHPKHTQLIASLSGGARAT